MELYLHLVRTVLTVMVSIGKVEYRMHGNFVGIYRDVSVKFPASYKKKII